LFMKVSSNCAVSEKKSALLWFGKLRVLQVLLQFTFRRLAIVKAL
jgi:hypothetical protein